MGKIGCAASRETMGRTKVKIKRLVVNGFRSLADLKIEFDNDLTVVVGENDSGKTSLIECLKVVTQGRAVGVDDFTHNQNELAISVEVDDFEFRKIYRNSDIGVREESFKAYPTREYVARTLAKISHQDFDLTNEEGQSEIKSTAKVLGISVRSNSNIENLKSLVIEKLSSNEELVVENASFPRFNNIQLDGRQFENVPAFFKEVFLKEKQANIWHQQVAEGTTVEDFVRTHLEEYSNDVSRQIHEKGIIDKLQIFLRDLTEIRVEPIFQVRDLNVDAKVKFLENGNEINIENKGDGTKRRITMALLEFKRDQSLIANDDQTIYLLDEPDTHLHVRAQIELIETVEGFAAKGNQVILTTHSPFIVNAAKPGQVRLLARANGATTIKSLRSDPASSSKVLRALGVENTHLFFSRKIVIAEGETEENFLPAQYLRRTQHTISAGLIKVINVRGVQNIVGFARALLELHDPERMFILCDNDASDDLKVLIEELKLPQNHKFQIGAKEFEDAFASSVLHRCWAQYHLDCGREAPDGWTIDAIEQLKVACAADGRKFSKELRALNQGGKAMTKPLLGKALGDHAAEDELPDGLGRLLRELII